MLVRAISVFSFSVLGAGVDISAQDAVPAAKLEQSIALVLETHVAGKWTRVNPRTVFHKHDDIRFRFTASLGGYLHVLNYASEGGASWLYPKWDRGQVSRVEPGTSYLVPGLNGSFVIGGKPGYDITYWIVSPGPIDVPELGLPDMGSQPNTLLPRCREDGLKPRDTCTDDGAGPAAVKQPRDLLSMFSGNHDGLTARDLTFRTDDAGAHISSAAPQTGVIVYEFRIAHN